MRQQGFRLAVIDTPPAITMAIQSVIQVAELIVIPTRPSPHDLRAVGATVDLCDRAGKPLIPGVIFSPGQSIPTKTSSKLLLTLGNASVKMTVNGQPVAVAPSSSAIGYLLTPTSHSTLPASQQPRCA